MLVFANYFISRSFLCPATLFSTIWMLSLVGVLLPFDTFYTISAETFMVYFIGALAFSAGGAVILLWKRQQQEHISVSLNQKARIHIMLDLLLIIVILGLPFYWQVVTSRVDSADVESFLSAQRQYAVEISGESTSFSIINNFSILAMLLALMMHYENNGSLSRRWRSYLAILIALIYGALTGTKGNAVKIILILLFISSFRVGKIKFVQWSAGIGSALLLFSVGLLAVNYFYIEIVDVMDLMQFLGITIHNYWVGGLISFEEVVQAPFSIESAQPLNRFFLETANSLGAHFYVPSIHATYTNISPLQATNVYTIYFSYYKDHGWLGVIFGLAFLGGITALIYRSAQRGSPIAAIFYAVTSVGIILSIHAEHFILWLNFYIKALIVLIIIYNIIPRVKITNKDNVQSNT